MYLRLKLIILSIFDAKVLNTALTPEGALFFTNMYIVLFHNNAKVITSYILYTTIAKEGKKDLRSKSNSHVLFSTFTVGAYYQ